jgi:hypothetical protein
MARRQALAEQLVVVEAALEEARRRVDELEEAQDALLALLAELDGAPDDDGTTTEVDEDDGRSRHGILEPRLAPVGPELPRPALPPVLEDADEEAAPPQPQATDAERQEERRLGTELRIELEAMLDMIEAQLRPLEHKICFALRAYARTLLVATYRARSRRDSGFITPPEMENIVCGGATQARGWRAPCPLRKGPFLCACACSPSPTRAPAGGQDHVRGGGHRGCARGARAVRGTLLPPGRQVHRA